MARQNRTVERLIARIASAAHGVITWAEMRAAEISEDEISHRVKVGALIPEYRGVYRVGHQAPSTEAHYMGAVKACGPGALLCGLAAAFLLGLLPPQDATTARGHYAD